MRLGLAILVCAPSLALAAPKTKTVRNSPAAEQAARGDAWAVAGRCDEAVKSYRKALELAPANTVVEVRLAHCLAKSGQRDEAKKMLTALADDKGPAAIAALQELGDLALQSNDFAGAVDAYDRLLAKQPTSIDARMALVDALAGLARGGDEKARTRGLELAGKLKTEPRADATQQRHAEELVAIFQYGDAAEDLQDGKRRLASGDGKGAVVVLERAIGKHAELEEAQYLLGLAYASPDVAKKDNARKAWKKAPHIKEAQLALGVDAYEGGDLDEAVKRLNGAAGLDNVYQAAYYQLGLVYKEQGESSKAREAWRRAMSIDPRSDLGKWSSTKLQVLTGEVRALAEGQVIDSSSEIGIGQEIAKSVTASYGTMNDPALEDRLNKILKRLAKVADRPEHELRYHVVLVDVNMINAISLPGGTILMFRGIIDMIKNKMGDSDDAYAAVLGHECAHAALRHTAGMLQVVSSIGGNGASYGGAGQPDLYALMMTVSRAHEFEADQFGSLYSYRAGFNPSTSVKLYETMLASTGEIPRGMTHPQYTERSARVRDYLLDLRAKVRGFDLGVKALGSGDYDAARAKFEVFLGVYPDSLSARSNLGVALHRKALTALTPATRFRRATDVDPDSRARKIELRAGETDVLKPGPKIDERMIKEAIGEYQAALAIDPNYVFAQVNLGAALDDLKDRKGARVVLEKAVRLQPSSKEAWNNLGAVAAETGDTARALEALGKAMALDGGYADALFNLGMTYEQARRDKDAAAAWDKYVSIDPKSGWTEVARQHRSRIGVK